MIVIGNREKNYGTRCLILLIIAATLNGCHVERIIFCLTNLRIIPPTSFPYGLLTYPRIMRSWRRRRRLAASLESALPTSATNAATDRRQHHRRHKRRLVQLLGKVSCCRTRTVAATTSD
jgi:hypothetical protein